MYTPGSALTLFAVRETPIPERSLSARVSLTRRSGLGSSLADMVGQAAKPSWLTGRSS